MCARFPAARRVSPVDNRVRRQEARATRRASRAPRAYTPWHWFALTQWRLTPRNATRDGDSQPVCVRAYWDTTRYIITYQRNVSETHRYGPLCGEACQAGIRLKIVRSAVVYDRRTERRRERRGRRRAVKENFHRSKVNECQSVSVSTDRRCRRRRRRRRCHRLAKPPIQPLRRVGRSFREHVRRANSLASEIRRHDASMRRGWLCARSSPARVFSRGMTDDAVAAAATAGTRSQSRNTRDNTHRHVIKYIPLRPTLVDPAPMRRCRCRSRLSRASLVAADR